MKMSARNLPYVHRLQLVINQFFAIPAAIIVAATGIYQVDKFSFDYGDFWLSGTIAILVVLFLVNIFFFIRPTGSCCRSSRRRSPTRATRSSSSPTCRPPISVWAARRASSARSWESC